MEAGLFHRVQVHPQGQQFRAGAGRVVQRNGVGHLAGVGGVGVGPFQRKLLAVGQLEVGGLLELDLLQVLAADPVQHRRAVVAHQAFVVAEGVAAVFAQVLFAVGVAVAQRVGVGIVKHAEHQPRFHVDLHTERGVPQRSIVHIIAQQPPHGRRRGRFGIVFVIKKGVDPRVFLALGAFGQSAVLFQAQRGQGARGAHRPGKAALLPGRAPASVGVHPGQGDLGRLI